MINGIRFKVCGLRRVEDARVAADVGADYLAFNFYVKSPRHLSVREYRALESGLPRGPERVAVLVEPALSELAEAEAAGFDRFQIHARHDVPLAVVAEWSARVGSERLWLAPKVPPGGGWPESWLPLASTFLVDTFHAEGFGGSGKTGDWSGFARRAAVNPAKTWILAGGLGPENIAEALAQSGASVADFNSGVESSPGVKSAEKLRALAKALALGR